MKNEKGFRVYGWRRGMLAGLIGLAAVGAAVGMGKAHKLPAGSGAIEPVQAKEEPGAGTPVSEEEPMKKKIALTFDDGPHRIYTEELLDGLGKKGVKATFFLLGSNIEGNEELVKRMAEEGHLIGNHTYYHVDITRLSQEEACREIKAASQAITGLTGQPVEYVRPPFGNWAKELECDVMMIPVFWSLDTLDWMTRNADEIVRKVVTNVEENDIILMHDSYKSTVQAALRVIDLLEAEGYEFVTADQLILE